MRRYLKLAPTVSQAELLKLAALDKHSDENRHQHYKPYPKQKAFHDAGATNRERALMALNRGGKTKAACHEDDFHLRGVYPDWWEGKRFDRPVTVWCIGQTGQSTRDVLQRELLGDMHDFGTGSIPKAALGERYMARGLSGTIDTQYVKHVSGKYSKLQFKSCEQGLMKLAGSKIDIVHFDEQPPDDVYSEGLMRTRGVRGGGVTYCTFTPLLGRGGVVDKFWPHPNSVDRSLTMMDITECPHFVNNPDEMRAFLEGLAPWEYEARSRGIPTVGQGRIFDAIEADVVEPHAEIPKWWPRLVGLDFGGSSALSHPTAAVWVAYEEEADTLHVYDEYRRKGGAPSEHAAAIRARGPGIPIAWPHDGQKNNTEGTSTIADMYRVCGAKMMPSHALFKDGTFKFDAGILEMYSRFKEGRFRVSERCPLFMEEYRGFSRDRDGKVIKVEDDLLAAARYAMMMRRYAKTPVANKLPITVGMDYDPLANVGHSGYTN